MKRMSLALNAFLFSYTTAHPVRSAIAIGIAADVGVTILALVTGASLRGAIELGAMGGVAGFLGGLLGAWLSERAYGEQASSIDPGQNEYTAEITYAAADTHIPDH